MSSPANRYVLAGAVSGEVQLSGFAGQPVISLMFQGQEVAGAQLADSLLGLEVTGGLGGAPDLVLRSLRLTLPRVHVDGAGLDFAAVALVADTRTSITGADLVDGVLDSYAVYPLTGVASIVES